jgi:type VI secretion system secreted protein VgrG
MSLRESLAAGSEAIGGAQVLPPVRYELDVSEKPSAWHVAHLTLSEGLSEVYTCVLDLVTRDLNADLTALEGASCVLRIVRGQTVRRLCGVGFRVEWLGSRIDRLLARLHLQPALATLSQRRDTRIFQNTPVDAVLREVLSQALQPYQRTARLDLDRQYQPREYCTQYAETDLDFALRLMSEEGMFFFFDQAGKHEELVVVDHSKKCPDYAGPRGPALSVVGPEAPQRLLANETLGRFAFGRRDGATGVTLRDFDWTRPSLDLTFDRGAPDGQGKELEVYAYPSPRVISGYDAGQKVYTRDEGKLRAQLAQEDLDAALRLASGDSNAVGLEAGMAIEADGLDAPQLGTRFLLTHLEHEGDAEDVVHAFAAQEPEAYGNRFRCAALEVPYRPRPLPRPVVPGPQTAIVVGPPGEEIHTDEHGRIQVQFHWDRKGKRRDGASCWIRVAQRWAGAGWGFFFVPRVGMEVLVEFLDGDPDRPVVTGCVYDGVKPPPYDLPAKKTASTIKTSSSPGDGGFNELRLEDTDGSEELFIQAQKDRNETIKQNHTLSVGGDQTINVTGNQSLSVKGAGQSPVHCSNSVTGKHQLDASDTAELQAPTHIKFTCGGSSILIEPGVITLQAGGGAKVVLDPNALAQSAAGSKVFLDANALAQASGGAKTLHDPNVLAQSAAGSKVLLDANALTQSSAGAKTLHDANVLAQSVASAHVQLDGNALAQSAAGAKVSLDASITVFGPANATIQGGPDATVNAPTVTMSGGGGVVTASGAGVAATGGIVDMSGGEINVTGMLVKIN